MKHKEYKKSSSIKLKATYGMLKDGRGFNPPTKGKNPTEVHKGLAEDTPAERAKNKA